MERRVRWKSHARCEWGENLAIISKDYLSIFEELSKNDIQEIYFDIDLDYFTESSEPCGCGEDLILMKEQDILSILDINSELMQWIFERMEGMTIATEPKFCGGVINSNKIYGLVDDTLFDGQLFSRNETWKHLKP